MANTVPAYNGTFFLNPRYVKKKYGHLPAWSTDDMGSLRAGVAVGDHYFINEIMPFKYKGKMAGK